jgi:hypothetical protein
MLKKINKINIRNLTFRRYIRVTAILNTEKNLHANRSFASLRMASKKIKLQTKNHLSWQELTK